MIISCNEENKNKFVSLRAAAAYFNSRKVAITTSCNCSSACTTKKCQCYVSGYDCSTHCHPFNMNCANANNDKETNKN